MLLGISVLLCPWSHGALAARFSGVTSHYQTQLLGWLAIFVPLVTQRDHWGKRDAFLSTGDSQYPHSMAYRQSMGSGTSSKPLSDSPLGYILRNWKILNLQKAWPQYKLGDTAPPKWPLNGTLAFAKSRERTQNFHTFSPSWPSVRIQV